MSWQRFNEGNHHFEKSDDNGATWVTLNIAYDSILGGPALPPNIAFTNLTNFFSVAQVFAGVVQVGGNVVDGNYPAFRCTALEAMDIVTGDQQRWAGLQCRNIYAMSNSNNLGDLTVRGGTNFQGGVTVTAGNVAVSSGIWANNLHTQGGYVYPGRLDVGGAPTQASWMIAGHGSYGLYINTGLYAEHYIWCLAVEGRAHIRAQSGLYDYGRASPIGDYTAWTPNIWSSGGGVALYAVNGAGYALVGHTLHFHFYLRIGIPAGYLYMTIPGGQTSSTYQGNVALYGADGGVAGGAFVQALPGYPYMIIYQDMFGTTLPGNNYDICCTGSIQIQ